MSEPQKKPRWPWIVGITVACLVAFSIGATLFFSVLWFSRDKVRRDFMGTPAKPTPAQRTGIP
jgi:hypothetical protein